MKRVTITLEFGENDSEYIDKHGGDIGLLLRDSLGEFEAERQPASEYVAKRYPDMTPERRRWKIRDVEKRCTVARILHRADVTILIEDKS